MPVFHLDVPRPTKILRACINNGQGVLFNMADKVTNAQAGPSNEGHKMRIASGGSIQKYVQYALTHLKVSTPTSPHHSTHNTYSIRITRKSH
jgi:hypothetical protein